MTRLRVFGCTAYVPRDKSESAFIKDPKLDPRGITGCFLGMAEDGGERQQAAIKGYVVWSLETGARIITSAQVSFDESRYPRLMGVTEWEFSLQTRVRKCEAMVSAMSFETEVVERHPFTFQANELEYREKQQLEYLNPQHLVGMHVTYPRDNKLLKGIIYSYIQAYKVWCVVPTKDNGEENEVIYVTIDDMAAHNKIQFTDNHRHKHRFTRSNKQVDQNDNVFLDMITTTDESEYIKHDSDIRKTQEIIDRVVHARVIKTKTPPITRHEPEPKSWKKAMETKVAEKWYRASEDEVNGLDKLETWESTPPIPGIIPIMSKWVFKVKYNPDGTIDKYKARLVVRGNSQRAGLDYGEVFSPVAHNTIARMLLSIATACDLEVDLVDVCQAFLNAPLMEDIYMKPAPGVNKILGLPEEQWLKLKRNLYGLKQAPRNWSITFIDWMLKDEKFSKASIDDCMYYREYLSEGKPCFIILLMYVDDNIIVSNDRAGLNAFKDRMHDKFKIVDKKDIETYLGIQVLRDRKNRTMTIHQTGYVNEVLAAMGIRADDPLTYDTPLPAGISLTKNEGEPYEIDIYRSAIGSLIYMSQWTRIDIAYAVSVLAAHMSNPSREHHVALKHVLHYLHGTRSRGITYHGYDKHGINQLYGFVDADFAGDKDSRKSRSGYICLMNSGAISWKTKLQTVSAASTTDAEVYAATAAIKEVAYLRDAMRRIGLPQAAEGDEGKGTVLYEDNEATTAIARTASHREATKHLAIARSFLRYHQENGTVHFTDCYTTAQVADFLTKPLGMKPFWELTQVAMGKSAILDTTRFARRNWREKYDESIMKKQAETEKQSEGLVTLLSMHICRSEAQRGMKKIGSQDLEKIGIVLCNSMKVTEDIDDFLKNEHHRLDVIRCVRENDMKAERRLHSSLVEQYNNRAEWI